MANHSQKLALWALPIAFLAGALISRGPTPSTSATAAVPEAATAMMQTPIERPLSDDAILERLCKRYGASTEAACKALVVSQVNAIASYYHVRTDNIIQVPPYCVEREMITEEELFAHFKDHVHGRATGSPIANLHTVTLDMLTAAYPCPRGPRGFEEVTMSARRG